MLFLPLLAVSFAPRAAAGVSAAAELAAQARALHLEEDREWLRLGHWHRTLLGGYKSQADGPDFFLAADGKTNPGAELAATLQAMYGELRLSDEQRARNVVTPECRFPARMGWLLGKLRPASVPQLDCPRLDEYWRHVDPESASLIFSSYYLNNPSSMFGHTFLRIRKRGGNVPTARRELLDSSVDFSATPDTHNPVLYAVKGLTGMFPGTFHLMPYYYKVREYNDYESRDLWEYELSLTPAQLAMLVAHLFELGSTWFDYYYADENCSYHVLAALEAAAPELQLLDGLKLPVVPGDTVKALYANPGLVKEVRYRPSAWTQFRARIAGMDRASLRAVESVAENPEAPVPAAGGMRILDAAADLIDVRYAHDLIAEPDGKGGRIKQRVLERRAGMQVVSPELRVEAPLERRPDLAHGSARVSAAFGGSTARGPLLSLGYRLSLHDLVDPPTGYPELSQIEFFPTELRFYPRDQAVELERIDFVELVSLHSISTFDQSLSWRVRAGARRLRDGGCDGCLAGSGVIGTGLSVATEGETLAVFAFADFALDAAPSLRGIEGAPGIRAGVGPSGGLRLRLGESLALVAGGRFQYFPFAISRTSWAVESSLRWSPFRNWALGATGSYQASATEAALQAFTYF